MLLFGRGTRHGDLLGAGTRYFRQRSKIPTSLSGLSVCFKAWLTRKNIYPFSYFQHNDRLRKEISAPFLFTLHLMTTWLPSLTSFCNAQCDIIDSHFAHSPMRVAPKCTRACMTCLTNGDDFAVIVAAREKHVKYDIE